jgi:putative ABC transport system permease protein
MMFILPFAGRHLWRHWRLSLALLLGLTLAAGLLAALPGYANMIADRSLRETILGHSLPAERNLTVSAQSTFRLTAAVYGRIQDALGDLLIRRMEVYEVYLQTHPLLQPRGELGPTIQLVRLWASDDFASNVRVVQGRWPAFVPPQPNELKAPPQEVAIGAASAAGTGLQVGDRITVTGPLVLAISAIVEPIDPQDDMWWGSQEIFGLAVMNDPNNYIATLPLLAPSPTLKTRFYGYQAQWRVLVDKGRITAANAAPTQEALGNLQTQLQSQQVTLSSGLPKILNDYQNALTTARMALFLLTAQALIFVLYVLAMLASFLLEQSQGELSTLAGRGSSRLQVTLVLALEGLFLGIVAALLGPLLAQSILQGWATANGEPALPGLGLESRALALLAVGFGWLTIVLPAYWAARRSVLEWQGRRARPERLAGWQRLYLDLFLLAFGGLAYWQFSQSGSFLMSKVGSTGMADPFLLLSSSLLLIAVALVFLRVFPLLLNLVAWAARQGRGLALSHSLARLARAPLGPSRVVLLTSLAAGLILFSNAFTSSLQASQVQLAHFRAGADLRITLAGTAASTSQDQGILPGVLFASTAFRTSVQRMDRIPVDLLAIEPATLSLVAHTSAGDNYPPIDPLLQLLQGEAFTATLPGIFSRSAVPSQVQVGDQVELSLAGNKLTFEVRALVDTFPTLAERFVVTDLDALAKQVNLDPAAFPKSGEAWLAVDPAQHAALVSNPGLAGRIQGDAQAELRRLQADAMAQGTSGAFQLNTWILGVLSVATFFLVHYFAARQRSYEFSLLRTMGLASGQLWILLASEGALVVGLGLLAGTGIGYGMAQGMIPYLSRALAGSLAGVEIHKILLDWAQVGKLYALLSGCYGLALAILLLALLRSGLHRVLRLGEE